MKVAIEFKDEDEWNHTINDLLKMAEERALKPEEQHDVHELIKLARIINMGEPQ